MTIRGGYNSSIEAANRLRAEWLLSITSGMVTVADLLDHASTPDGSALRSVTLRGLLEALPEWGVQRARTTTAWITHRVRAGWRFRGKVTVGWIVDRRSPKRRAWFLELVADTAPAMDGYPHLVLPEQRSHGVGAVPLSLPKLVSRATATAAE